MRSIGERLKENWLTIGERVRPGASPEAIESFTTTHKVFIPLDLRDFYSTVDGMEEDSTDDFLLHFFPLNAVKAVTAELVRFGGIPDYRPIKKTLPEAGSCFVFADYMIASHFYAIRLSSDRFAATPIIWICGSRWQVVATTFSEFAEMYFAKSGELLMAFI